jgi:hypothetical protein
MLDRWMSGEAPAWHSPPLLAGIRDTSDAAVLTEPLASAVADGDGRAPDKDAAARQAAGAAEAAP